MKMFSALLAVLILYDVLILQVLTFYSLAVPHYPHSKNRTDKSRCGKYIYNTISNLSNNLNLSKHTLRQCLYRNARTCRL